MGLSFRYEISRDIVTRRLFANGLMQAVLPTGTAVALHKSSKNHTLELNPSLEEG